MKTPIHKKPVLERIEFYDYKEPFKSIFINYRKGNIDKEEGLRLFLKEVKKRKPLYDEINKKNYKKIFEILSRGSNYFKKKPAGKKYAFTEAEALVMFENKDGTSGCKTLAIDNPATKTHKKIKELMGYMLENLKEEYNMDKCGIDYISYRIALKNPHYIWNNTKGVE